MVFDEAGEAALRGAIKRPNIPQTNGVLTGIAASAAAGSSSSKQPAYRKRTPSPPSRQQTPPFEDAHSDQARFNYIVKVNKFQEANSAESESSFQPLSAPDIVRDKVRPDLVPTSGGPDVLADSRTSNQQPEVLLLCFLN